MPSDNAEGSLGVWALTRTEYINMERRGGCWPEERGTLSLETVPVAHSLAAVLGEAGGDRCGEVKGHPNSHSC